MGWFFDRVASVKQQAIDDREPKVAQMKQKDDQLKNALRQRDDAQKVVDQYTEWIDARFSWADVLTALRDALLQAQRATSQPGMRTEVWVERMASDNFSAPPEEQQEEGAPRPQILDIRMMIRYGLVPKGFKITQDAGGDSGSESTDAVAADPNAATPEAAPAPASKPVNTNEISTVNLTCRAISWARINPTADSSLAEALRLALLANTNVFLGGTNGTRLSGDLVRDEANTNTFRFEVKLKLAKPIKL
jgi:hypothetical protein